MQQHSSCKSNSQPADLKSNAITTVTVLHMVTVYYTVTSRINYSLNSQFVPSVLSQQCQHFPFFQQSISVLDQHHSHQEIKRVYLSGPGSLWCWNHHGQSKSHEILAWLESPQCSQLLPATKWDIYTAILPITQQNQLKQIIKYKLCQIIQIILQTLDAYNATISCRLYMYKCYSNNRATPQLH